MKTEDANECITREKQYHKNYFLSILFIGVVTFFGSCNSSDDPAPPAAAMCKVQSQSGSGTGNESATVTYTYNYVFSYTYDAKGNHVGTTSTYNYTYSNGKTATSSSSSSRQFDDNGFMLREISQYNSTDKDGVVSNQSNNTDYKYENDRLSKQNTTYTSNGVTKAYSLSYEYDTDGKLVKFSNTYDNSYTRYEYSGNKIQKATRVDAYGNSNSPFLEYNQNGLLVKSIETRSSITEENRYEYDAEGQQIRYERIINGKPYQASSDEYDVKENPNKLLYARPKGHPNVPWTQPEYAPKHNLIKSTNYSANATTSQWEISGTVIYTYDYNSKDLPVDVTSKNLDKAGAQLFSNRYTYQYQDCL